jgi:hypothetical protein
MNLLNQSYGYVLYTIQLQVCTSLLLVPLSHAICGPSSVFILLWLAVCLQSYTQAQQLVFGKLNDGVQVSFHESFAAWQLTQFA